MVWNESSFEFLLKLLFHQDIVSQSGRQSSNENTVFIDRTTLSLLNGVGLESELFNVGNDSIQFKAITNVNFVIYGEGHLANGGLLLSTKQAWEMITFEMFVEHQDSETGRIKRCAISNTTEIVNFLNKKGTYEQLCFALERNGFHKYT